MATTDAMFQISEQGPHGETLTVEDPKRSAYARKFALLTHGHPHCDLTFHEDGHVTVSAPGSAPLTYAPRSVAPDAGNEQISKIAV